MKYNGVDPRTLHPGISIAKEIPPGALTSQLETISGSSGEIIIGRTIQQAEYIVRINIAGKNKEEAWRIRKLLAGWACAADTQAHPLIPTHWDTVSYDAILKEITPPEFKFGFATVDVIFALPRAIAREKQEINAIGATGKTSVTAEVGGTSYARPVITITLKESNGMTAAIDKTTYFAMTGHFAKGDKVEIDLEKLGVRVKPSGGSWEHAENRMDYTQTDLLGMAEAMKPGARTISCPEATLIHAIWRDEWL